MRVPQLLQQHAMDCEREGAFSEALLSFAKAAEGLALQLEAEDERCGYPTDLHGESFSEAQDAKCVPGSAGCRPDYPMALPQLVQAKQKQMMECLQGKARCALQAGELHKGLQLATDINDPRVYRECAEILLRIQQPRHAAALLHRAGHTERAAALYIQVLFPCTLSLLTEAAGNSWAPRKHRLVGKALATGSPAKPSFPGESCLWSLQLGEFDLAAPLLRSIGPSAALLETYAHAREQQQPLEALRAFGRAEEFRSMVRILVSIKLPVAECSNSFSGSHQRLWACIKAECTAGYSTTQAPAHRVSGCNSHCAPIFVVEWCAGTATGAVGGSEIACSAGS